MVHKSAYQVSYEKRFRLEINKSSLRLVTRKKIAQLHNEKLIETVGHLVVQQRVRINKIEKKATKNSVQVPTSGQFTNCRLVIKPNKSNVQSRRLAVKPVRPL